MIEPRQDYTASEDDNVIVRAVQSGEGTVGYFGFTYYEENADTLKLFSVDGVEPNAETITRRHLPALAAALHLREGRLAPAARGRRLRPLHYAENAISLAEGAQFVPAPQSSLDEDLTKLPAE